MNGRDPRVVGEVVQQHALGHACLGSDGLGLLIHLDGVVGGRRLGVPGILNPAVHIVHLRTSPEDMQGDVGCQASALPMARQQMQLLAWSADGLCMTVRIGSAGLL